MLRDRCPLCHVCLSVTLVYCGNTVGWIKMPLGTEEGLVPGGIVLDGDPCSTAPQRRGAQQPPTLLWHGRPSQQLLSSCLFGRPFVKRFAYAIGPAVLYCLSCPDCNVGVLWPNGLTDQDETWRAGRPRPWQHCVRWGPSSPSQRGTPPNFWPISVAAKWLHRTKCHLVWR